MLLIYNEVYLFCHYLYVKYQIFTDRQAFSYHMYCILMDKEGQVTEQSSKTIIEYCSTCLSKWLNQYSEYHDYYRSLIII